MPMTHGDVQIYYETRGPSEGIPVLFIQGFTRQLIGWREGFCQSFVDCGALVILFDSRDVGLSQQFGGPEDHDGGYGLTDMASDGFRVLDELGLTSAHVLGASMGGMIAQAMALSQPARVRSLNLIHTSPNLDPAYFVQRGELDVSALAVRLGREEAIETFVAQERKSASTAYPVDEKWMREHGARAFDRCYSPAGAMRQLAGMARWTATPEALRDLQMPASIIHGRADGRIKIDAALALGRLLRTAELHIYPGLGHEIPAALWDDFATIIMRTAARA